MLLRALLMDDEDNNLNTSQFLPQNDCEGIEVAGRAKNAQQARHWLQNSAADVVFLDINMPGENGFQFSRFCLGSMITETLTSAGNGC